MGERPRGDVFVTARVGDKSAVHENVQWWNPAMKPQVEALQSSVVEGADGAISLWVADERSRVLGQVLSLDEEQTRAELVRGGKLRELSARKTFDVYTSRGADRAWQTIAQTR